MKTTQRWQNVFYITEINDNKIIFKTFKAHKYPRMPSPVFKNLIDGGGFYMGGNLSPALC